ncbi:sigma-54 dependent transcriptional regulator [Noviherbaspirillum galbum]|uniref:Sigma-54-dependent Fis family transcriptional regulator n=1 Tax=Noviherbaspirillum galbum TaxID=2709383 RepID=A0A6B3SSA6_9BURK|nr:sigma-54 dependent transcriptional regulator [Noviherbaspirillum galbum]NEX63830.1 sigma-54-dependent Fis family transcriptional regulator [Noviherbaspirillum galbum]
MTDAEISPFAKQHVVVLQPGSSPAGSSSYVDALAQHGMQPVVCATMEDLARTMQAGARVGLLMVTDESALDELEKVEAAVTDNRMSWVGLISKDLITRPRLRQFIATHLFNFITLPADPEHVVLTLRHAWGMAFMREAQNTGATQDFQDSALVGRSAEMQRLLAQVARIARTDTAVLITGASGTGKEAAARAIHRQSPRCDGPFVVANCSAEAPQAVQEELFGPEGRIASASGGTLYLDEIGDLPAEAQAGLVRHLQSWQGAEGDAPAPLRLIASSRADLAQAVHEGRFREDLYYRINVVALDMPLLADRGQDIEDIARHYFTQHASVHNKSLRGFSKAAMNAMLSYAWPGNVRELVNRVQRATVMAEGRFIQPEDLGFERETGLQLMSLEDARAAAESAMIRRALSQSRNQISRAAALLGVSRVTLYRLIEKYNIRPELVSGPRAHFLNSKKQDMEMHKAQR